VGQERRVLDYQRLGERYKRPRGRSLEENKTKLGLQKKITDASDEKHRRAGEAGGTTNVNRYFIGGGGGGGGLFQFCKFS